MSDSAPNTREPEVILAMQLCRCAERRRAQRHPGYVARHWRDVEPGRQRLCRQLAERALQTVEAADD